MVITPYWPSVRELTVGTEQTTRSCEVAEHRGNGEVWINHAAIGPEDVEWLHDVEWLTLWNVTVPPGLLGSLRRLWGLDLRGGSGTGLGALDGCKALRCLVINQIRGLRDLSTIGSLISLELLELYGLKQVESVPSLSSLTALRRLNMGLMRGLRALDGALDAPGLEELSLYKWMTVTELDLARIKRHPSLRRFHWLGIDVPEARWVPVNEGVGLPPPRIMFPRDWFESENGR